MSSSFFQHIHVLHYQHTIPLWWRLLALIPTLLYGVGVNLRNWAYQIRLRKSIYLPCPVISVGNLTTGGTGKTPTIIAIAQHLYAEHGLHVGILSRGYGARDPQAYALATSPDYGDEAYMIQQACPHAKVVVGVKRKVTAQRLLQEHPIDVILLDDGFQHLALGRDINILLVDATTQFGNARLLPMGPLREPLSAIKRAHLVLLTRCTDPEVTSPIHRLIDRYASAKTHVDVLTQRLSGVTPLHHPEQRLPMDMLTHQPMLVFSGIGNPRYFEEGLRAQGAQIIDTFTLADHAPLEGSALHALKTLWDQHAHPMICCTEKDAVKLTPETVALFGESLHVVHLQTEIPTILNALLERYIVPHDSPPRPFQRMTPPPVIQEASL